MTSRYLATRNKHRIEHFKQALSIGFFLAIRDIRKANFWTTTLIVAVMVLTFLNLIVISGILVGLVESSIIANKERYTGDLIVSTPAKKDYVERSVAIQNALRSYPEVDLMTSRYVQGGTIEANYKQRTRLSDKVDSTAGLVAGIDPEAEDAVTGMSRYIIEGRYLTRDDTDSIMIGSNLLAKYSPIESPGLETLKEVEAGTRVRLVTNGTSREVTVIGVLKSKVGEIDQRIFMVDRELRKIIGRDDFNVDEIVVTLREGTSPDTVKASLLAEGFGDYGKIQTYVEAQPKFLKDITATFAILGNLIGTIGLAVACITIFIIIFVNAITRRRFIGILKGIGIQATAIEVSYIIQSVFYALCGIVLGSIVVFAFLKPFIAAHPIDFPFSDGILVAEPMGTFIRAVILLAATMIAGYIPARLVVKQNTLDAILGR